MSWYCNTCEKGLPTNANPTCDRCAYIEKNLEQYLDTLKGRQFVRSTLTKVALQIRSRGEREDLEASLREKWANRDGQRKA